MPVRLALFSVPLLLLALACRGGDELLLATTTSVQDTGLLDALVAAFERDTRYNVKPLVVGTGQALALGRHGEVDVVLSHSPVDEERFLAEGHGSEWRPVMRNFFVIVGPGDDPAGLRGLTSAKEALRRIAATRSLFLSRGDRSGTHLQELSLWQAVGIAPSGSWYQESGAGQGINLSIASDRGAYTLTDDSTFLVLAQRLDLEVLVRDPALVNVYSVILVNPEKHSQVKAKAARAWLDFLVSERGQAIIRQFGREEFGQPLFQPAALAAPVAGD